MLLLKPSNLQLSEINSTSHGIHSILFDAINSRVELNDFLLDIGVNKEEIGNGRLQTTNIMISLHMVIDVYNQTYVEQILLNVTTEDFVRELTGEFDDGVMLQDVKQEYNFTGLEISRRAIPSSAANLNTSLFNFIVVHPVMNCEKLLELNESEYTLTSNQTQPLILSWNKQPMLSDHVVLYNGTIRICYDHVVAPQRVNETNHTTDSETESTEEFTPIVIVTLICVTLSLLCLLLTTIAYIWLPLPNTLPWKNNIALIINLFTAQILFQAGVNPYNVSLWVSTGICCIIDLAIDPRCQHLYITTQIVEDPLETSRRCYSMGEYRVWAAYLFQNMTNCYP